MSSTRSLIAVEILSDSCAKTWTTRDFFLDF